MTEEDLPEEFGVLACVFAVCTGAWLGATYIAGRAEWVRREREEATERGR